MITIENSQYEVKQLGSGISSSAYLINGTSTVLLNTQCKLRLLMAIDSNYKELVKSHTNLPKYELVGDICPYTYGQINDASFKVNYVWLKTEEVQIRTPKCEYFCKMFRGYSYFGDDMSKLIRQMCNQMSDCYSGITGDNLANSLMALYEYLMSTNLLFRLDIHSGNIGEDAQGNLVMFDIFVIQNGDY